MTNFTPMIEVEISPGYQAPSYFHLLKHFDSIYASGLFCHIAKPGRKRDQQLRLVWAVEQMVEKLREVRDENLQFRSPFFHAKRYISSPFPLRSWLILPLSSPDPLNAGFHHSLISKPLRANSPSTIAWNVKPGVTKKLGRD